MQATFPRCVLLTICGLLTAECNFAQTSNVDRNRGAINRPGGQSFPSAGESTSFSPQRYARPLNSPSERMRSRGLARLLHDHPDHPQTAALLLQAVDRALASRNLTDATRDMVRALGGFDRPDVMRALLDWLDQPARDHSKTDLDIDIVLALAKFNQPEVHRKLISLLKSEDHRIVMVAVDVLGQQRCHGALDELKALVERPEYLQRYGFRLAVLQALCRYHNGQAIDFLVSELPTLDGQSKFAIVDYLSRISRQDFGSDVRKWKEWWEIARPSYQYTDVEDTDVANYVWDYPVPTFYDFKIYAKRVVFVIDISSTMTKPVPGTRLMRLDRAKSELVKAVSHLPSDGFFNIVAFDRRTNMWQRSSVQATPQNKQRAIKAVQYTRSGRGTAIFDALDAAFRADENVESIYVLSDGLPSAGRITNPDQIVRMVTDTNRFRRITINSISVGRDSELLRDLSKQNNGGYRRSG